MDKLEGTVEKTCFYTIVEVVSHDVDGLPVSSILRIHDENTMSKQLVLNGVEPSPCSSASHDTIGYNTYLFTKETSKTKAAANLV